MLGHLSNRSWRTQHEASRPSISLFTSLFSLFLNFFSCWILLYVFLGFYFCSDAVFPLFVRLSLTFLSFPPPPSCYFSSLELTRSWSWHVPVQQNLRWMEMLTRWWSFHTSSTGFTALSISTFPPPRTRRNASSRLRWNDLWRCL